MEERKKQSLINGALVLTVAIGLVKITGILFKLYITNKIGFEAKGSFAAAYNIYTPVYSIALAGLPVAVSKLVAEKAVQGQYRDVKKLFSVSLGLFTLLGVIGTLVIVLMAYPYSVSAGDINALPAVLTVAPSLLFCCIMSGYRGYYQGLRNMTPTSVSQVIESAGKLIFGYVFMNVVLITGVEFADKIPILNRLVTDASSAYAAAAAISGVTIGSAMGLVYIAVKHRLDKHSIPQSLIDASPEGQDKGFLRRELLVTALPFAVSSLVFNLTTFIDSWTIQNRLMYVLETNFDTVAAMYPKIIEYAGYTVQDAAKFRAFLFGAYDTVLEIKNIIPTLTIALGSSALPLLSELWISGKKKEVGDTIKRVFRLILLMALPAGIGMCVLAEPILLLIYGRRESTLPAIEYIAPILMLYGISVCFLALAQPVTNMLQAIDKPHVPLKSMAAGAVAKVLANMILVSIPSINIQGAVVGSFLSNIIMVLWGFIVLKKEANIKYDWKTSVIKPLFCSVLSGAGAYGIHVLFIKIFTPLGIGSELTVNNIATIIAVGGAVVIYIISVIATKTLQKSDVIMLPKGEKIAKVLEKYRLLG
ncbi:MAG: polysaccharide biosynthesis protein [Clostridia bacterium]|nr:polysaccharide biosynthesis protein [Clostridia bacterium]